MSTSTLAIPSALPGGLEAGMGMHFGHCDINTIVQIEDGAIKSVGTLPNVPHQQGGCLAPVQHLASHGVTALLAGKQRDLLLGKAALCGGLRRGLRHRAQAEGRKDHAPPVLSAPVPDDQAQGGIPPRRKGEIGILLGGEPHPVLQGGGHRIDAFSAGDQYSAFF